MRLDVVERLNQINREFYAGFATAFAESRGESEPGLERLLADAAPGQRWLDLGCGQGRVALLLPPECAYVGLDFAPEMLALARSRCAAAGRPAHFVAGDLLDPQWPAAVAGAYDRVLLRAVLHHIPGAANRREIVRAAAGLLAPEGRLILANWQFLEVARLRRRLLPWETLNLTAADVEPGDYLLDWRREGRGLRYVHWVDEAETRALAEAAGLTVQSLFYADGHQNRLTLYAVLFIP